MGQSSLTETATNFIGVILLQNVLSHACDLFRNKTLVHNLALGQAVDMQTARRLLKQGLQLLKDQSQKSHEARDLGIKNNVVGSVMEQKECAGVKRILVKSIFILPHLLELSETAGMQGLE